MVFEIDEIRLSIIDSFPKDLSEKIIQWLEWDQDVKTRNQVLDLVDCKNVDKLSELLLQRQCFGTAGIRGFMEAGFNGINNLIVIQTTQGLAQYLKTLTSIQKASVVIGYDGRYSSASFARLAANVLITAGFHVHLFSQIVPTPFVAYATKVFESALAGIMITASHNPKQYNGYKVFFSNGAQVLSPHDKHIQNYILKNLQPWNEKLWDTNLDYSENQLTDPLNQIKEQYYHELKKFASQLELVAKTDLKLTYTPLHGVGNQYVDEALKTIGFHNFYPVLSQKDPDPEFSTVDFPNPEEGKGVLFEAIKTAEENDSGLIFANDPDADRFCMAEFYENSWKVFSGNEIGALFGWWLCKRFVEQTNVGVNKDCYMISSAVSSQILKSISIKEGFSFQETLTGFKWMANLADELEKQGKRVLLAFEEAIGFMIGTNVLDKDGISALVEMLQMAAFLESKKLTFTDQLNEIYKIYGYHYSLNSYFLCYDQIKIQRIFDRFSKWDLQNNEINVNGTKLIRIRNLIRNYDSSTSSLTAQLPHNCMVTFYFENHSVITFRTSGTEPKIKFYSEIKADPNETDWEKVAIEHQNLVNLLVDIILEPEKNKLILKKD